MPDFIGGITVPEVVASGTFPLTPQWGHVRRLEPQIIVHRFDSANAKIEHRFLAGPALRRWGWPIQLTAANLTELKTFWNARKGSYQPFNLNVPNDANDGTTTAYVVTFANAPLSWEHFVSLAQTSLEFVEVPQTFPTYATSGGVLDRFPDAGLESALLSQVQEVIPLVKITTRTAGYPVIYLSDRRCTVGGQLYQARLTGYSGISQKLNSQADTATFGFGNADRVMSGLDGDVDLYGAAISFSLFHVEQLKLLNLWTGVVENFGPTSETEYAIAAVDGLAKLTLQYPNRKVTPLCWKAAANYNDGENCPFGLTDGGHTANVLDTANYPLASAASCDGGYRTPNGCMAHTMKRYFGGIEIKPQSVRINGPGSLFGFGAQLSTSTSLVAPTNAGITLADIYTDIPMPVEGAIFAGRDENTFYEAGAIIGSGPLSSFGLGTFDAAGNRRIHRLDGQAHHGDPGSFGLREILGSDPAGATDFLSLDQSGNQVGSDPEKVFSGNSTYLDNFAAGTAALVIRRVDEKGFQLTQLAEHTIQAIVGGGLKGWVWTAPSTRTEVGPMTNVIWVAVNTYLRGNNRYRATAAAAEGLFDLSAALTESAICDLSLAKLIGSGSQTQFQFRGTIKELKPLRDWLQEILNNSLGFWLLRNGKFTVGLRRNASSIGTFNSGNIISGSLQVASKRPQGNMVNVAFANSDFEFVQDTLSIPAMDRIAYDGQAYPMSFALAGAADKSTAGRIGAVRLKEELGGATLTEMRKARHVAWKSTILAVGAEVGQVYTVADWRIPGGTGKFRLTSWRLNQDHSIDFDGETVTDSMYDVTAGPKPVDVPSTPVPVEFYPEPLRSAWFPNQASPLVGDPLYDQYDKSFDTEAESITASQAARSTTLLVTGSLPINGFLSAVEPPTITAQSQSTSGGTLLGVTNYWARVYMYRGAGASRQYSPGSNTRRFTFETVATDLNSITVSGIDDPAGSFDGLSLFAGDDEKTMCWQADFSSGTTSMTLGNLLQGTFNAPSNAHRFVRAKVKQLVHGGTVGVLITGVTSTTITCSDLIGFGDDWSQRYLSVLNKGVLNFLCGGGWNDATGTFTVATNPVASGVVVGDVLLVLLKPTTYTTLTIGDSRIVNGLYPTGAVVNAEKGLIIRGITPGKPHQLRRVVSNTSTIYTVDQAWEYQPAYFFVEAPDWQDSAESSPIIVPSTGVPAVLRIPVDSLVNQAVLVGGFLVDSSKNETPEEFATIRAAFIFGEDVARFVGTNADVLQTSEGGAALTGGQATGDRTRPTATLKDFVFTGKIVCDGFTAYKAMSDVDTIDIDSTFLDADADQFDSTWMLHRYNDTLGGLEPSFVRTAGVRVWTGTVLGSSSGGSTGPWVDKTGAATVTLDLTTGSGFSIPLDRATTTIVCANGASGMRFQVKLTTDATPGRAFTLGSGFAAGGPTEVDVDGSAAAVTFLDFVVNSVASGQLAECTTNL